MAYIPKDQYKLKTTNGGEFTLNNSPFTGDYLELSNGRFYAGDSPENIRGELIPLVKLNPAIINLSNPNNLKYSKLKPTITEQQSKYLPIVSNSPLPTLDDYIAQKFVRYIVVKVNTKEYTEVDVIVAKEWRSGIYDTNLYDLVPIMWSLKSNNEEINSSHLLKLEPLLPGIYDFFRDKGKYKLTNGTITINSNNFTRIYPTGELIPQSLPASYSKKEKVKCINCEVYRKGHCLLWDSTVKVDYSCSSFKEKSIKT